uniref:(northern house mosquito) hypothetical protein n=1 Tax=Culex pipiens TaxID=7175 RepID=A0A8D8DSE9_CULPI
MVKLVGPVVPTHVLLHRIRRPHRLRRLILLLQEGHELLVIFRLRLKVRHLDNRLHDRSNRSFRFDLTRSLLALLLLALRIILAVNSVVQRLLRNIDRVGTLHPELLARVLVQRFADLTVDVRFLRVRSSASRVRQPPIRLRFLLHHLPADHLMNRVDHRLRCILLQYHLFGRLVRFLLLRGGTIVEGVLLDQGALRRRLHRLLERIVRLHVDRLVLRSSSCRFVSVRWCVEALRLTEQFLLRFAIGLFGVGFLAVWYKLTWTLHGERRGGRGGSWSWNAGEDCSQRLLLLKRVRELGFFRSFGLFRGRRRRVRRHGLHASDFLDETSRVGEFLATNANRVTIVTIPSFSEASASPTSLAIINLVLYSVDNLFDGRDLLGQPLRLHQPQLKPTRER